MDNVHKKIVEIISNQLGVDPAEITPEASFFDDLGMDSLDAVELVMTFEEEFNMEIPDEDAEKAVTVADVFNYFSLNLQEIEEERILDLDKKFLESDL